jgi:hypothetical protein
MPALGLPGYTGWSASIRKQKFISRASFARAAHVGDFERVDVSGSFRRAEQAGTFERQKPARKFQ